MTVMVPNAFVLELSVESPEASLCLVSKIISLRARILVLTRICS